MTASWMRGWSIATALMIGNMIIPPTLFSAEPPKVSTYAPAEDLVGQADEYIADLEKIVACEQEYNDCQDKIAKDSNTLAVIALALGMHDEPNRYKASAVSLMKAAQNVADSKDFASAQKAVATLKVAAKTKDTNVQTLTWQKAASLPELMKQVPLISTKLKMKAKGKNFKKNAKQTAGYAAVLAVIAQGTMADVSAAKNEVEAEQWRQFSAASRDIAGQVNAAIRSGDEKTVCEALQKLNQSCEDCHAVFKPEEVNRY